MNGIATFIFSVLDRYSAKTSQKTSKRDTVLLAYCISCLFLSRNMYTPNILKF